VESQIVIDERDVIRLEIATCFYGSNHLFLTYEILIISPTLERTACLKNRNGGIMKYGVFFVTIAMLLVCSQVVYAEADDLIPNDKGLYRGGGGPGGFLGQLSTAEAVPSGSIDLGAYVGFYDDANALFGQFRIGAMAHGEWEVKAGVLDSSDPHAMIGTAFKYHFYYRQEESSPDMAVNAIIEYYGLDSDGSSWIFGTGFIASYPFRLSNNSDLTPYGRLSFRVERLSVGGYRDSDFDIGLNLGAQYAPTRRFQIYTEFQLDDQFGLIGGINFAVY
jgi:hypothetical protein